MYASRRLQGGGGTDLAVAQWGLPALLCLLYVCTFLLSGSLDRLYRVGAHILVIVVRILLLQFVNLGKVLRRGVECAHAHVRVS